MAYLHFSQDIMLKALRYALIPLFLLPLIMFNAQENTPPQLATCPQDIIDEALVNIGTYTPSDMTDFVRLEDNQLTVDDESYPVRGINYYPSAYPWRRFLTETDLDTFRADLELMHNAGFNTLRIFLWNTALFNCPGSGAVPNWGVFQRLDGIIRNAGNAGFRLIVTLNDLPDMEDYPLYTNPLHTQLQTIFIVERYRDEAAILAWDLRNEGDIDYGSKQGYLGTEFNREQVLAWLGETADMVRRVDENHLITAGWLNDAEATAPYVDFVSFHHWEDADSFRNRLNTIRAGTDKPILVQEFGYSTFRISQGEQAAAINQIIRESQSQGLLGWMIWTAFDFPLDRSCFPSPCVSEDNAEHHFGIWNSDGTPKSALELLFATSD